jgi:hypothetical protein
MHTFAIEAIWQLYKSARGKILVCAPSNAAVDHILEKLVSTSCLFLKEHIFTRNIADIKPSIDFCILVFIYSFIVHSPGHQGGSGKSLQKH